MTNASEATYARQAASIMESIAAENDKLKDILASAKDAGINPSRIRKAAKELMMEPDKRDKLYEAEHQLDLLRDALGLTGNVMREAAE